MTYSPGLSEGSEPSFAYGAPKQRLRLGIDLDGVVANFIGTTTSLYRSCFPGATLHEADVVEWDFLPLTHFSGDGGWPAYWEWMQSMRAFLRCTTYPGATLLLSVAEESHDVVYITHRPLWAETETRRWLIGKGLLRHGAELVVTNGAKSRALNVLGFPEGARCDVYLDDGPKVLAELRENAPEAKVVRMVRAWNRPIDGVVDLRTWADFSNVVLGSVSHSHSMGSHSHPAPLPSHTTEA